MSDRPAIAFFISPHGLGHAARSAALIEELYRQQPALRFVLFTGAPEWFFRASLTAPFDYVEAAVDVGLVQRTATDEDLPATVAALAELYPLRAPAIARFARDLQRRGCIGAVCDIAPLGLAAARRGRIPAVLVENFTWDWIYAGYESHCAELGAYRALLAELFDTADLHIQTVPICRPHDAAIRVGAIARRPRAGREATRARLGFEFGDRVVTMSMGGIPQRFEFAASLAARPERFVLLGQDNGRWPDNVVVLPHRSGFHHPDLLMASDVLVGKLGYSTVAEAWRAGVDWLWIDRPAFRETAVLGDHVQRHHRQVRLEPGALSDGGWTEALDRLAGPVPLAAYDDGAPDAAAAILRHL